MNDSNLKNKLYITIVFVMFFSYSPAMYGQSIEDQFEYRSHEAYNKSLPYRLFIPSDSSGMGSYPLVLILHGGSGSGTDNDAQLSWHGATVWAEEKWQQNNPAFVLVPQSPADHPWYTHLDVLFDLILNLLQEFPIDSTRLYVSGHSKGGFGTWDVIQSSPFPFAAAVPSAGGGVPSAWPYVSHIPAIWNFHGINDDNVVVEYSRSMIHALEEFLGYDAVYPVLKDGLPTGLTEQQLDSILQTNPSLIYSETYDGHNTLGYIYDDQRMHNWLFAQQSDFEYRLNPPSAKTDRVSRLTQVSRSPVLSPGLYGSWDDGVVLNPAVIQEGDTLKMWYVGFNRGYLEQAVGYAWSVDGLNWIKHPANPVFNVGDNEYIRNITVSKDMDLYHMWYDINGAIYYAWSKDGLEWTRHPEAVLAATDSSDWAYPFISVGTVIKIGDQFNMWYTGGFPLISKIGYATSADGIHWMRYDDPSTTDPPYHNSDPVLIPGRFPQEWDFQSVLSPLVYKDEQGYKMWYTGQTIFGDGFGTLNFATSTDGISWLKSEQNPALAGPPGWSDDAFYRGGSVLKFDDVFHIWYTHLDYQYSEQVIGYARDYSFIARSDSVTINKSYFPAGTDTLRVKAWIVNPYASNLNVAAHITSVDSQVNTVLPLIDVGGGYWQAAWPIPSVERTYGLTVETTDQDSNTVHYSISVPFTSIGPLNVDHYHLAETGSNTYSLSLFLRNNGQTASANEVTVYIKARNADNIRSISPVRGYFKDIDAQQTDSVDFNLSSTGSFNTLDFAVTIFSNGILFWQDSLSVDFVTSVSSEGELPLVFKLEQNYPNPFNPSTTISWQSPMSGQQTIKVFDILGQEITTLVNEVKSPGNYEVNFNANNLPSGVYFYRLQAGSFVETKKMMILK